jgi:hypothetical protein
MTWRMDQLLCWYPRMVLLILTNIYIKRIYHIKKDNIL